MLLILVIHVNYEFSYCTLLYMLYSWAPKESQDIFNRYIKGQSKMRAMDPNTANVKRKQAWHAQDETMRETNKADGCVNPEGSNKGMRRV